MGGGKFDHETHSAPMLRVHGEVGEVGELALDLTSSEESRATGLVFRCVEGRGRR
ncbi:hypothetical protein GCM10027184_00050 [Saccharothrix stipae]